MKKHASIYLTISAKVPPCHIKLPKGKLFILYYIGVGHDVVMECGE
jgi:hypothetical protein